MNRGFLAPLLAVAMAAAPLGAPVQLTSSLAESISYAETFVDVCYDPVQDEFMAVYVKTPADYSALTTGFSSLLAQRFRASDGQKMGAELPLDSLAGRVMGFPSIACAPASGRFLVAYAFGANSNLPVTSPRYFDLWTVSFDRFGAGLKYVQADDDLNSPSLDHHASPDVAFDGTKFLIVWSHRPSTSAADINLRGRFISAATGAAVWSGFAIDASTAVTGSPVVAWLGGSASTYLVAYAEAGAIKTVAVSATQVVGVPQTISVLSSNNGMPAIAADPTDQEWLVAWQSAGGSDVWFRRVLASGALGLETALQNDVDTDELPAVAWNASDDQYVVHWVDGASVRAALIDGGTETLHENGTLVSSETGRTVHRPALAAATASNVNFAVWSALESSTWTMSYSGARYATIESPPIVGGVIQTEDSGAPIPAAGAAYGSVIRLQATVDADDADLVRLLVEVRPSTEPFLGLATHSTPMSPAGTFSFVFEPPANGAYHWQYNAIDSDDVESGWTPFSPGPVHFVFQRGWRGSVNTAGCSALGVAGARFPWGLVASLLALSVPRRRGAPGFSA